MTSAKMSANEVPQLLHGAILIPVGYSVPNLCIRCGSRAALRARRDLLHYSPLSVTALWFAICGWVGYLMSRAGAYKAEFRFHLCSGCFDRNHSASGAEGLQSILWILGVMGGGTAIANGYAALGSVAGVALCAAGTWVYSRYFRGKRVKASLISPTMIRVTNVALTSLEDWPTPN